MFSSCRSKYKNSRKCSFLILALTAFAPVRAGESGPLKLVIGPEQIILPDGLQPFLFQSAKGTLILQAQLPFPPGYVKPPKNAYPGLPGTVRSTDGGKKWQRWSPSAGQREGPIFEGNAVALRDGTILVFEWVAEGPRPDGTFMGKVWESADDWQTLTGPFEAKVALPDGKGGFDDGGHPYPGVNIHRSLIELPDGDLLSTAYGWFKPDSTPTPYMKSMNKFRSILLRSKDRGRNWSLVSTIAVDPAVGEEGFAEPALVRLTGGKHQGRLIAHMRTGRINNVYQTESDNEGRTWTKPHVLPFHGVDPDLIEMKNGIVVSGFGWRTEESLRKPKPGEERQIGPQHGNYVAFSLDQGESWVNVTQVTKELTTSYVTVREVQPDRLLLVYDKYWWDHKDRAVAGRFVDVVAKTSLRPGSR